MKKVLVVLGMALAMTGIGSAASLPCSSYAGTSGSFLAINAADGCFVGDYVIDNFNVIVNFGTFPGGAVIELATGVGIGANGEVVLPFALGSGAAPLVAGPLGGDILLQYQVTGPTWGAQLFMGSANNVTITEVICTTPFAGPLGTSCLTVPNFAQSANLPNPPGKPFSTINFGGSAPLAVAYIQKDIQFGANGSISDFVNTHTVPEPTTSLLMGTALLGLALLRKRYGQK